MHGLQIVIDWFRKVEDSRLKSQKPFDGFSLKFGDHHCNLEGSPARKLSIFLVCLCPQFFNELANPVYFMFRYETEWFILFYFAFNTKHF